MSDTSQFERTTLPNQILLEKWLQLGFFWQGEMPISNLPRLYALVNTVAQNAKPTLSLLCQLQKKDDGIVRLYFQVAGCVYLDCHRCLQPMALDLTENYQVALLKHADEISRVPDEEYILLEELGESRYLPIKDLLEDELLLSLPIAIHHDHCQISIESIADDGVEIKENPFAILASLKGNLS